ncbi:hypothetical protein Tco_0722496 [Tanacetum coccineum]
MDEEATHKEDEANELYRDVDINLEGRDTVMTDAPLPNVQGTQVTEDTHVIITASINPEGIDIIFTPNTEATSLVDVLVTTIAEPPLLSGKTLPPTPLITHMQQTPVPTPATVPSSSLQDLPNFGSLFGFDHRLKTLETDFSEFKQTNQFAKAVSSIPGIVDAYLANKMHEAIKTVVQLQSERLKDEAQAENADFLNKLDDNIKKIIKDQVKEQVKAQVSKILPKIEKTNKMESNKLIYRSDEQKNLYKALVDAYESNKLIFNTYGDTISFKRCRDDEDKDKEPSAGSNRGSKRRRAGKEPESTSLHQREKRHPNSLAQKEDPRESFNELMDTPLDFSAFVMNRLKVDTLTPELLTGPTFELMKGSCKSLVELEYLFEEVYKATTDQLDWNNPEGQQYPHDLRKPLPLIPNSRGRRTKAADYGHIKWIEDLVPNRMWSQVPVSYDKHALWGISHWGQKRQQFYGFAANRESARDVYSKRRIIAVIKLEIVDWHNYKHLDWITVRKDDDKLYKFKEGDFNRLCIQDIKDMLLLLNKDKKNRLMRIDELHKFSDGTLNDVRTALNDHLKGIWMEYLPQTIWRQSDKDKAGAMIQAIDTQLKTRRIMRSLEKFVGRRPYEGDFRLLQRTI